MKSIATLACAALCAFLTACGGGGGGGGSSGIGGGVVKGPVSGSTVCAYAVSAGAKGPLLRVTAAPGAGGTISGGCYVTDASGAYGFLLPPGFSGDVILEAQGGLFCTTEVAVAGGACASGTLVNLGTAVMRSAVSVPSDGTASVYVTPLTTAAVDATSGTFSASAFGVRFTAIASQVLGTGSGVTPSSQPTTSTQPYLSVVGNYLAGGGSLDAAVASLAQGTTTFPPPASTPTGVTSTVTVNAGLFGVYSDKAFFRDTGEGCGSHCSFVEAQTLSFTVTDVGQLVIAGQTLSNPYQRDGNAAEVIWLDASAQLEYTLANNSSGTFAQLAVGDASRRSSAGRPTLLGNIRTP